MVSRTSALSGRAPGARAILPIMCILLSLTEEKAVLKLNTPDGMIGSLTCFSDNDGQTTLMADGNDTVEVVKDSYGVYPRVMQQVIDPTNGVLDHTDEVFLSAIPTPVVPPIEKKLPGKEEKVG
jgi:hypothetical protein